MRASFINAGLTRGEARAQTTEPATGTETSEPEAVSFCRSITEWQVNKVMHKYVITTGGVN